MGFLKRNINGILGTILFHLVIIIIAMAFSIKSAVQYKETYMLIDPQYLEEMEQDKEITDNESEMSDLDIENYMQELRNVGSNYNQQYSQEELQAMSQEEIKQMYEEQILKEKYGDDYEEMMNSTYEDYLNQDNNSDSENNSSESSNASSGNNDYAGPALVYVELENPDRGKAYIDVPVFTCRNGGTVVIKISIDSDGRVKSASVQSVNSTGDGTCISNSARQAALQSRFTTVAGGKTEYGTITYQFIQQ